MGAWFSTAAAALAASPGRDTCRDQDAHARQPRTRNARGQRGRPSRNRGDLALLLQQVTTVPITADHIRSTLTAYLSEHPEEKPGLAPVLDLLNTGADLTTRTEFRGHATAGVILAGPDGRILHIRHLALGRWLTPGGHLEITNETLQEAALRELTEETGMSSSTVTALSDKPLHIDVHPIPVNNAKGEPAHQHIDFRFLFRTDADVGSLQAEEVTDAAWRDIADIADDRLRQRIADALR
jgi:8-oxo-dGTP pyrophosphatase MutT (NUDIX family)